MIIIILPVSVFIINRSSGPHFQISKKSINKIINNKGEIGNVMPNGDSRNIIMCASLFSLINMKK